MSIELDTDTITRLRNKFSLFRYLTLCAEYLKDVPGNVQALKDIIVVYNQSHGELISEGEAWSSMQEIWRREYLQEGRESSIPV